MAKDNLCAVLPNVRIMEIDIDDVPWKAELVTRPPAIKDGHIFVPTESGWAPRSTKKSCAPTLAQGQLRHGDTPLLRDEGVAAGILKGKPRANRSHAPPAARRDRRKGGA